MIKDTSFKKQKGNTSLMYGWHTLQTEKLHRQEFPQSYYDDLGEDKFSL